MWQQETGKRVIFKPVALIKFFVSTKRVDKGHTYIFTGSCLLHKNDLFI